MSLLCGEIIAVCSEIHTKHINTVCGDRMYSFCMLTVVVHKVTTGLCDLHCITHNTSGSILVRWLDTVSTVIPTVTQCYSACDCFH